MCNFQPPRWHKGWRLLQAVDFGPACPQPVEYTGATKGVRDMDEDCLYLNVYSPTVSTSAFFEFTFYLIGINHYLLCKFIHIFCY